MNGEILRLDVLRVIQRIEAECTHLAFRVHHILPDEIRERGLEVVVERRFAVGLEERTMLRGVIAVELRDELLCVPRRWSRRGGNGGRRRSARRLHGISAA